MIVSDLILSVVGYEIEYNMNYGTITTVMFNSLDFVYIVVFAELLRTLLVSPSLKYFFCEK